MSGLVLGEAETNFIVESEGEDDDELGPVQERDRLEKVARVVRNSYEFAEDSFPQHIGHRERSWTTSDRWSASATHIKKRIQSTKRHTKGALKKKYNEIKIKRHAREDRKGGPSQPSMTTVFGVPLAVAVQRSVLSQGIELPTIVRQCIDFLEENGLDHEGVFRLSGVKSKIEAIKALYDRGDDSVDFSESEPNVVSGTLKLFLRELPESVLGSCTEQVEELLVSRSVSDSERLSRIRDLLRKLPRCNYLLISWLITHLSHVAANSSVNKMSNSNLIIVFSPTLQLGQNVLNYFFQNAAALFSDVELKKYDVSTVKDTQLWSNEELDKMDASELTWALLQTEDFLSHLNKDLLACNEKEKEAKLELIWPYQRQETQIKRLLRPRAKRLLSNTSLGKNNELLAAVEGTVPSPDQEQNDWDSLQGVVLLTLEAEVKELEVIETDLRQQLAQEKEWTEMVQDQIADLPPLVYEDDNKEDASILRDLEGQIEQWEDANDQLCSDLAHENHQAAHFRAQMTVIDQIA